MAVYTEVGDAELDAFLADYDIGEAEALKGVAEGVEDERSAQSLRQLGCDLAQGYFFARPMPHGEFTAWWREFNRVPTP